MAEQPIILPIATVQDGFQSIIDDVFNGLVPEDKFWLSCYKTGEQSVHGKVHLSLNERDRNLVDYEGQGGVQFAKETGDNYTATCTSLGILQTPLSVPVNTYSDFLKKSQQTSYRAISAFDIAPDGSQFAAGHGDGSICIVPTASRKVIATAISKPHLSTVTSIQFFPSSRVVLTAGVDFSLAILSADPSTSSGQAADTPTRITPVRTLKGHSRAVTSTAIISRGRTILSGSKDGTVRIWDVSSGDQIRTMGTTKFAGVLSMSAGERSAAVFTQSPDGESSGAPVSVDSREVDTADKIVFCGLSDGSFEAFDLNTKLSVFRSATESNSSALHSIAYSAEHNMLTTGSAKGLIRVYDTRSLSRPLVSFARNGASIEDIAFTSLDGGAEVGLAIATEDGLPYTAHVRPEGPSVRSELTGSDCDPIRCIRVRSATGEIWTAGDDGIVRKYDSPRSRS